MKQGRIAFEVSWQGTVIDCKCNSRWMLDRHSRQLDNDPRDGDVIPVEPGQSCYAAVIFALPSSSDSTLLVVC